MKNLVPKYQRPLKSNFSESIVDVASWYECIDAFDEKKFAESTKKFN